MIESRKSTKLPTSLISFCPSLSFSDRPYSIEVFDFMSIPSVSFSSILPSV